MRRGRTSLLVMALALLLCCNCLTLIAKAQVPNSRLGYRTAPILLLTRSDVRAELQLNPKQVSEFRAVIAKLYERALALQGRTGPQAVADRRSIDESGQRWLAENLSEAQLARLDQIDLQWEGPSALVQRPSVAAALDLSDKQRSTLQRAIQRRQQRIEAGEDREPIEQELAETALTTLTPDQQARWKIMLGPPFQPSTSENSASH